MIDQPRKPTSQHGLLGFNHPHNCGLSPFLELSGAVEGLSIPLESITSPSVRMLGQVGQMPCFGRCGAGRNDDLKESTFRKPPETCFFEM